MNRHFTIAVFPTRLVRLFSFSFILHLIGSFFNTIRWGRTGKRARYELKIREKEQIQVCHMRSLVEKDDKEVDDVTLRRFLRACDLDVEEACVMFRKYLEWRKTFVPNGSISASKVSNQIAHNKVFLQGFDKKGQPIGLVFGSRHVRNSARMLEFKRFVVYCVDKLCDRMLEGHEKLVVIADFEGWGYSNTDIPAYIASLMIFKDYYPERLGKLFIVNSPTLFRDVWKLIDPLINKQTKKKIIFVEKKKLKSTLLKDIDESQLPEIYGGKLPLVPPQDT